MKLIADLHIHSHYSRATSKNLTFEHLTRWAQLKGIQVVGTGDIAHPGWLQEMKDKLEPAEDGLFRLKDEYVAAVQGQVPPPCQGPVRFVLGGEISNIYKRDGKTRKVHNLVFLPDLAAVERLQARLDKIGNIRADGRPILGLDSHDLLEIVLDNDPRSHLIPAHIWTPWFSLLGSKSGFDAVEACYGDLTQHIFALETGLSSDPPMNWRVSALDRYTLVSNSDAHSPEKLGRETTLFNTELAYSALFDALKTGNSETFQGTVEFFPEEGKYHFDGHRSCGIVWDPPTTLAHGGICPVCGKEVTVGVMHRVEALADRPVGGRPDHTPPFISLVPLPEVLGEVYGVGAGSKQVETEYVKLLNRLGPEIAILREFPLEDISASGGERLAAGISRMRRGEVMAQPGYDGEYGVVKVFAGARASVQVSEAQIGLFGAEWEEEPDKPGTPAAGSQASTSAQPVAPAQAASRSEQAERVLREGSGLLLEPATTAQEAPVQAPNLTVVIPTASSGQGASPSTTPPEAGGAIPAILEGLNDEQRAAVLCTTTPLVIIAGPGTGKTRTLTVRIAYLILHEGVAPEAVLAITFTNKAAEEMVERLAALLGPALARRVTIKTFHAFGALLLREHAALLGLSPAFVLCTDEDRRSLLRQVRPDLRQAEIDEALDQISEAKNRLLAPGAPDLEEEEQLTPGFGALYREYQAALRASQALDFDDLIMEAVRLLETQPAALQTVRERYRWISVDEYQDVNLAQYRLLRLLTGSPNGAAQTGAGSANLCVIGDPDQAIYGFRGADRHFFLSFQADYPGAQALHLSQNYRSTQLILDAAVQVINRQSRETEVAGSRLLQAADVLADFADQVKLDVYTAPTDKAEAEYVVHQIEQMVGGTSYFSLDSGRVGGADPAVSRSFADFAVLYRLGAQSRLLVEAFARSGIPFQTVGETPLYAQPVVRECLAHLWLLHNPGSRPHLETVLATGKPALTPKAAAQVWEHLASAGSGSLAERLVGAVAAGKFTVAQRERLAALAAFWRELTSAAESQPVAQQVEQISRFIAEARGEPLPAADAEHLQRLALAAVSYEDRLPDFLESSVLQSDTDSYDPRADRVALMTLHAAKGLEFPVVFILGCEEGLLPYKRPGTEADVEEERRLFYVGMTRARQKLLLVNSRTRFLFGRRMENQVSRFVDDIANALKEVQEMQPHTTRKSESAQLSLF